MTFTAKQFAALNHFAKSQAIRNCSIYSSTATVENIENHHGKLFASVESVDDVKGIFHSFACVSIGPRGGVTVYGERRDVY
jgi:hypothetical protein